MIEEWHCDRGMQVLVNVKVSVARAGHRSGASDQCDLLLSEERELSQLVGGGGERVCVCVADWSVCVNDGNPPGPPPPTAFPCRGSVAAVPRGGPLRRRSRLGGVGL